MRVDEAYEALAALDPPQTRDTAADDALLARILESATPASPPSRSYRRPRVIALTVAVVIVVGLLGFRYAPSWLIGSAEIPANIEQGRQGVPLPPGVKWNPIPYQDTDTYVDARSYGRHNAIWEATCRWDRYWADAISRGDTAAQGDAKSAMTTLSGLAAQTPGMRSDVPFLNRQIATASQGDTRLIEQNLRVNCTSDEGGYWTIAGEIQRRLHINHTPAVALVLAVPIEVNYTVISDYAQPIEQKVSHGLEAAGLPQDVLATSSFGTGVVATFAYGPNADRLVKIIRQALSGSQLNPGSYLLIWHGPADDRETRIPIKPHGSR
jgi:hypothetical protein